MPLVQRLLFFWLITGVTLCIATAYPIIAVDGAERYNAALALLSYSEFISTKYSLVQPILSLPLIIVGQIFGIAPVSLVSFFNSIVLVGLGFVVLSSLRRSFGTDIAVRSAILLLSASMVPHHLQFYYAELFSAFALVAGLMLLPHHRFASSILAALGLANMPSLIVPFSAAALFLILKRNPHRNMLIVIMGLAVCGVFIENLIKYGSLVATLYLAPSERGFTTVLPYSGQPGFSYPLFFGILSIVMSFGKGILFFIPGSLVVIREKLWRPDAFKQEYFISLLIFMALLVVFYSKWWSWYGGNFWGPRFFLILCFPASLALALASTQFQSRGALIFIVLIMLMSGYVSVNGVIFGQENLNLCWQNNFQLEFLCWYVPEYSALWRPFVVHGFSGVLHNILTNARAPFALWQILSILILIAFPVYKHIKKV